MKKVQAHRRHGGAREGVVKGKAVAIEIGGPVVKMIGRVANAVVGTEVGMSITR